MRTRRPRQRAVHERTIVVDGETFFWRVSPTRGRTDQGELRLSIRPQQVGCTLLARIPTLAVQPPGLARAQDAIVSPALVRALITALRGHWPTGRTLTVGPTDPLLDAARSPELTDAVLRAAYARWNVPYPGRAALERAYQETAGDVERTAARFPGVTIEKVRGWLSALAIAGGDSSPR